MTRLIFMSVLTLTACTGKRAPEEVAKPVEVVTEEAAPKAEEPTQSVLLKPEGLCTMKLCPPELPCCNSCAHSTWVGAMGQRIDDVSTFKVELDGCGRSDQQLWAAVSEDGTQILSGRLVETRQFTAVGACTKMACPEENPCCNQCNFSSWTDGQGMVLSGKDLPTCELDGCGECATSLSATGWVDGSDTFVSVGVREVSEAEPTAQ